MIIIMAQIGCYVPAKLVSIQPFEKLLVCMGIMDSIESNKSSFMVEMRDIAHIASTADNRCSFWHFQLQCTNAFC